MRSSVMLLCIIVIVVITQAAPALAAPVVHEVAPELEVPDALVGEGVGTPADPQASGPDRDSDPATGALPPWESHRGALGWLVGLGLLVFVASTLHESGRRSR